MKLRRSRVIPTDPDTVAQIIEDMAANRPRGMEQGLTRDIFASGPFVLDDEKVRELHDRIPVVFIDPYAVPRLSHEMDES